MLLSKQRARDEAPQPREDEQLAQEKQMKLAQRTRWGWLISTISFVFAITAAAVFGLYSSSTLANTASFLADNKPLAREVGIVDMERS